MTHIPENTFAACYNDCTIADLETALAAGPDTQDMADWGLTATEWQAEIELALKALREDA